MVHVHVGHQVARPIQRLRANHYKMLEMLVAGFSKKEIAAVVGCTTETVQAVSRSPIFQAEYQRALRERNDGALEAHREAFIGKAASILEQASESAANTQVELLESEDDSIRLRASGSILDRVLGKPEAKDKGGGPTVSVHIDAENAQLLIIALKESNNAGRLKSEDAIPDLEDAGPAENGHGAVHQEPPTSSGE